MNLLEKFGKIMAKSGSQMDLRKLLGLAILLGIFIVFCIGQGGKKNIVNNDGVRDDEVVGRQTLFIVSNDGDNGASSGESECNIDENNNNICNNDRYRGLNTNSNSIVPAWKKDERFWYKSGAVGTTLSRGCMYSFFLSFFFFFLIKT